MGHVKKEKRELMGRELEDIMLNIDCAGRRLQDDGGGGGGGGGDGEVYTYDNPIMIAGSLDCMIIGFVQNMMEQAKHGNFTYPWLFPLIGFMVALIWYCCHPRILNWGGAIKYSPMSLWVITFSVMILGLAFCTFGMMYAQVPLRAAQMYSDGMHQITAANQGVNPMSEIMDRRRLQSEGAAPPAPPNDASNGAPNDALTQLFSSLVDFGLGIDLTSSNPPVWWYVAPVVGIIFTFGWFVLTAATFRNVYHLTKNAKGGQVTRDELQAIAAQPGSIHSPAIVVELKGVHRATSPRSTRAV
jgi:hypothetical protein